MKRTPLRRNTPLKRRRTRPRRRRPVDQPFVPFVPADQLEDWVRRGMPFGHIGGAVFLRNDELKRRRTKYARRERDTPRMLWVKSLPCCVSLIRMGMSVGADRVAPAVAGDWLGPMPDACNGPVHAHHAGEHGTGNKAPDDAVIPLCEHHHADITNRGRRHGAFSDWPRGAVKRWELAMVAIYQERYAARSDLS